jgi:hypothetical protein
MERNLLLTGTRCFKKGVKLSGGPLFGVILLEEGDKATFPALIGDKNDENRRFCFVY